ncbi:MAG: methyltransferase domain-containing protein [Phycisphaerales bacterium JB052]
MNQQWLIDHVLETGSTLPKSPGDGRSYLTLAEAETIVDASLDHLGAHGDETEYTYMRGHRTRLTHALTMIPKADSGHTTLLDIGCYGYMGYWAKQHLGYEHVTGIEWHPENEATTIERSLSIGDERVSFQSLNFDITQNEWPLDKRFDTVLFFEVLEHINEDPMGVMERINACMKPGATLVMSVPNAISYKSLREFLVGMPPWTYWFYEPDLSHEPRHCFEYTPIVFRSLLTASGMSIGAMRTIFAYTTTDTERDTLAIAESLGFDPRDMGETMIAHCTKSTEGVPLRYPDVLYSPDGYYKNVYPRLQQILQQRFELHRSQQRAITDQATQIEPKPVQHEDSEPATPTIEAEHQIRELLETCEAQFQRQEQLETELQLAQQECGLAVEDRDQHRSWAGELQAKCQDLESQVRQLLFQSDCRLQQEQELREQLQQAHELTESAQREQHETRAWADRLAQENAELRAQVNELLFACDCYLQQINDPQRCVRVIRERRFRWALDRSKAMARKTPVVRSALRPMYRSAKRIIKRRM